MSSTPRAAFSNHACAEGNYGLEGILAGARDEEAKMAGKPEPVAAPTAKACSVLSGRLTRRDWGAGWSGAPFLGRVCSQV